MRSVGVSNTAKDHVANARTVLIADANSVKTNLKFKNYFLQYYSELGIQARAIDKQHVDLLLKLLLLYNHIR